MADETGGGPPIARVGDPVSHGGEVVQGSDNVLANGRNVARLGDMVNCYEHGLQPIVGGCSETVLTNGRPTARSGSTAACGAVISSDSNVLVGG